MYNSVFVRDNARQNEGERYIGYGRKTVRVFSLNFRLCFWTILINVIFVLAMLAKVENVFGGIMTYRRYPQVRSANLRNSDNEFLKSQ